MRLTFADVSPKQVIDLATAAVQGSVFEVDRLDKHAYVSSHSSENIVYTYTVMYNFAHTVDVHLTTLHTRVRT